MARPSHQWDISGVRHMKIVDEDQAKLASSNLPVIVDALEAERLIEGLKKFELKDVGSSEWLEQHRKIEKLNLQAHQNAMTNSDEYIMEAILTFNKAEVLIHNLLIIETWKDSIYPLLEEELAGKNSMRLYFILYHEASLVNMFEVFFYYRHFVESLGERCLEIVDYVGRKLIRLNNPTHYDFRSCDLAPSSSSNSSETAKEYASALSSRTPVEELKQHYLEIELRVCVSSVSLARFLCEHGAALSLSVQSRITDTHDYLLLIIPLIENPPWTRRLPTGKWQKLIDLKWSLVQPIDLLKITKLEGQPWLTIYHLIAKPEFRERYHLNTFRKGQLLRVRKFINDLILDQLPFLADIQRYMDELTVLNVPEPNSLSGGGTGGIFLFQQVAPIKQLITKGKNYEEIASYQKEHVFTMTDRSDKDLIKMAELYSDDTIEQVLEPRLDGDEGEN